MQSTLGRKASFHVAIIMDGNGRWAARRGLSRLAGHRAGVETARRIAETAHDLEISKLTLFAFSSDNWRRPPSEVDALMALLRTYLETEIARAELATASGDGLNLRIAIDYSARAAIAQAAICLALPISMKSFARLIT